MTHMPSSGCSVAVRVARLAAVVAVGASALALGVSPALAAQSRPTITSAFTPNLIGVGDATATALSFTITNPNSSSISKVAFSDQLPAPLTIDNPNGENGTCGSSGVITANPGTSTISLSGGSIKAGSSCTFFFSLIATQPGVVQNSTGPVTSSAGASSSGDTETLTILPPPTVTVTHLRERQRVQQGQVVRPRFPCTQPNDPSALADCSAADDLGNVVRSGGVLPTPQTGHHTLTVSATSADGLVTTKTIDYTVLPDNRFTIRRISRVSGGALQVKLSLPGAGHLVIAEVVGHQTIARYTRHLTGKRTIIATVRLSPAGLALLAGAPLRVKLEVAYTPSGGIKRTKTRPGIVL
jgi:hypothetical protein